MRLSKHSSLEAVFSLQTFVLPKRNADNSKDNHGLMTELPGLQVKEMCQFQTYTVPIRHAYMTDEFPVEMEKLMKFDP